MVENELPFLRWSEFRQMAPSILRLEVTRLGTLIDAAPEATDFRNLLVKARYELKRFIACVQEADRETLADACAPHLEAALLNVSLAHTNLDEETATTLRYVADRLQHVNERLALVY